VSAAFHLRTADYADEQRTSIPKTLAAYRRMAPQQRLERGLRFIQLARQFKIESVRVHHPGWSEEKVQAEVRQWVRGGMKPEELYQV